MLNNIISVESSDLYAELDSAVEARKIALRELRPEQRLEFGLGEERVYLGGSTYKLYRNRRAAYMVAPDGGEYELILETLLGKDDEGEAGVRWKVGISSIKKVPGLYDCLKNTRLFASIGKNTKTVYLYRLVFALHFGEDIFYDEQADDEQIHIGHRDQIACNDHYSNLMRIEKTSHLNYDTSKTKRTEQAILDELATPTDGEVEMERSCYWLFREADRVESLPYLGEYWV